MSMAIYRSGEYTDLTDEINDKWSSIFHDIIYTIELQISKILK